MAAGSEIVQPFAVAGEAPVLLIATEKDQMVDPVIWGDDDRMKKELVAWAKAVASMALNSSVGSMTPPPSSMGHMRQYSASRLQRTS